MGNMSGPEDNPRDDGPIDREAWERFVEEEDFKSENYERNSNVAEPFRRLLNDFSTPKKKP
jgi:hypothetical protein